MENFNGFKSSGISQAEYDHLLKFVDEKEDFELELNGETFRMTNEDALKAYILKSGVPCVCVVPEKVVSFDKMAIYLENSASMAGYSNAGNPMFTAPILALFNACEPSTTIETAYVGEQYSELKLKSIPRETFERELTNGGIAVTEGSPLDKIMTMMIDSVADNSVVGLVTDGIVSGSNREIVSSANREFTIRNLPLIEQRIRGSIKNAAAKDISTLIYRLESSYAGTYYDYKNGRHNVNNVVRPYFIVLFGNSSNLKKMEVALESESKFNPTNKFASYDVVSYNTITNGYLTLAPATNVKVVVTPDLREVDFKGKIPAVPVNFRLQVDLNGIPAHYRDSEVLRASLDVYYVVGNTEVSKSEFVQDVTPIEGQPNKYQITLQMDNNFIQMLPNEGLKLYVRLKGRVNRWDAPMSSDEDTQFGLLPDSKTFALTTLMDGICNGYAFNKGVKDVLNVKLTINK
ncbi:MAG: hypothetical protein IKV77_02370 [Alistipes sp.]|nr:hypothetical protein [Alistipes sp.]